MKTSLLAGGQSLSADHILFSGALLDPRGQPQTIPLHLVLTAAIGDSGRDDHRGAGCPRERGEDHWATTPRNNVSRDVLVIDLKGRRKMSVGRSCVRITEKFGRKLLKGWPHKKNERVY